MKRLINIFVGKIMVTAIVFLGVLILTPFAFSDDVYSEYTGRNAKKPIDCFAVGSLTGMSLGKKGHEFSNVFLFGDFLEAQKSNDIQVGYILFGTSLTRKQREFIFSDPQTFKELFNIAIKGVLEISQEKKLWNSQIR